jgi:hypothetical protein
MQILNGIAVLWDMLNNQINDMFPQNTGLILQPVSLTDRDIENMGIFACILN